MRGTRSMLTIEQNLFVKRLVQLSGVSGDYAIAAWYTCNTPETNSILSAERYHEKYLRQARL